MSNVLSEEKREQILALGRLEWPLRRIEKETEVRRETVSKYLKQAGIPLRPPRGRKISKAASQVSTDPQFNPKAASEVSAGSTAPPKSQSACEIHREFIVSELQLGRNAMGIYQHLVDSCGFTNSYASVKRYVSFLRGNKVVDACAVIETTPGEESQVDYAGKGPMVRNPATRKYRRMRMFIFKLGYSRKAVRLLVWKSDTETWARLHETAFRRLGGSTKIVILDNLREGVIKPDIYDPALNPVYRDMLNHYGVTAIPCRVRDPDRKGKVERDVGHTQGTALKGMRFESSEEAQAYLDHWDARWADTRIHGTTKRQVSAMFLEEKPYLQPLPVEPFRYYRHGVRTVHLDGTVEVKGAYYGAPAGWVGRTVHVQWDEDVVRILDPGSHNLLREHQRQIPGRYHIEERDKPRFMPHATEKLLMRAKNSGISTGILCDHLYKERAHTSVRAILGILSLVRKHGSVEVENACTFAVESGVYSYRFIRRYLEHKTPRQLTIRQIDPLIRELTAYRTLIEQIPTEV